MMWGDGSGGWWGPGVIFMIFGTVMMVRMMSHGHGAHRSHGSHTGESHGPGGAERILAERLTRGEIDIEQYERRRAALQQASELDRP